jgi:outer membrane protein OmpA-like peptidoglycan-associated protein
MIPQGWALWDSTIIARDSLTPVPVFSRRSLGLMCGLCLIAAPVAALELAMPAPVAATRVVQVESATMALPTGPYAAGAVPTVLLAGVLDQRVYRLDAKGMALNALAGPLRAQLEAQGYTILLDCEARACGGFDFRFAIDVMPEPDMHVDLGEFRFLSARIGGDEAVTVLVSRSSAAGFVQITRIAPEALPEGAVSSVPDAVVPPPAPEAPVSPLPEAAPDAEPVPVAPEGLIATLVQDGSVALDDLVFGSGSAALEDRDYASLAALAVWLKADPARSVVLVGHTDGSGALAANVRLSKLRAEAVRQVLLARFDVAGGQVAAEGAGPLAPRASNSTEGGRQKNRRVEAVVTTSTQ